MNNRVFVGNLAFHTTQDTLEQAFAQIGEVTEVRLMMDRETGRSRGFAFVVMATADGAREAIAAMNGQMLDGRVLRVNPAEERRERSGPPGGGPRRERVGGGGERGGERSERGPRMDRGGERGGDRSRSRW